jgi:hypothetical protein
MRTSSKDTGPRTTIWRDTPEGICLVQTLPGLPSKVPKQGEVVYVPGYGEARCSGTTSSGTPPNETVTEVKLTII